MLPRWPLFYVHHGLGQVPDGETFCWLLEGVWAPTIHTVTMQELKELSSGNPRCTKCTHFNVNFENFLGAMFPDPILSLGYSSAPIPISQHPHSENAVFTSAGCPSKCPHSTDGKLGASTSDSECKKTGWKQWLRYDARYETVARTCELCLNVLLTMMAFTCFNPFKPSGAKWLHYKVFKAILV